VSSALRNYVNWFNVRPKYRTIGTEIKGVGVDNEALMLHLRRNPSLALSLLGSVSAFPGHSTELWVGTYSQNSIARFDLGTADVRGTPSGGISNP